ncbi:zinc finger, CCHC-type containing protein [Tanacetum coccineum]
MGDKNLIRTLGDYSKPSHEGYRNSIELPEGNNVDFLKLVDSLDLDGDNRERTRLRLFQFSLRNQASNWLERLLAGSFITWEDLTTQFLAQFFPPGRTVKLRNDILMFQQLHGESLSEAWTRFNTDNDTEEEDVSSTNACDLNLGGMVKGNEGVKEQGNEENEMEIDIEVDEVIKEEESEFETDEEDEEILEEEEDDEDGENFNLFLTIEEVTHHEWLLKNPRPLWVKTRIRAGSPNNIKISCMVGHLFKRHAYIDLESPINIMSRRQ